MKQDGAKLSVVIPIYNVEPYLRQCLDSVVNQTYRNLEIILVDDSSPDNCGRICDEYAQKDDRVLVIHKQNGGVSAARNDGIERATGEWITFVDSDDWCDLDYYEKLLREIKSQDVNVVCSGGIFEEFGNDCVERRHFKNPALWETKKQMEFLMVKALIPQVGSLEAPGMGGPWDKIYKLSFLRQNQLVFNTALHPLEDILFNFMVFDHADRVLGSNYVGYHYRRQQSNSVMHKFNPRITKVSLTFINSLNDYALRRQCSPLIHQTVSVMTLAAFGYASHLYFFHKDNPYCQTVSEINALKREPFVHDAIYNKNHQFLTKKKLVLKRLLALPWVWPLKLAYGIQKNT